MPASFDGNDGNDGNAANSGGGGNASSNSAGWFFADRVNLPLVTEPDTGPNAPPPPTTIGQLPIINRPSFADRNWSAEWYSWLALTEFVTTTWNPLDIAANNQANAIWPKFGGVPVALPSTPPADWSALNATTDVQTEISGLVTTAANERADTLGEILSQANEFISYFLNMMTARPGAYPATTKVLGIASLVGTFVAMHYKAQYRRPRPSQLCPALLPPIEVPGHASFPSGHSTQAHLMALCMADVFSKVPQPSALNTMADDLWTLAGRIARNREIAGLHYPSDTQAGVAFAYCVRDLLNGAGQTRYLAAVNGAVAEWTWP